MKKDVRNDASNVNRSRLNNAFAENGAASAFESKWEKREKRVDKNRRKIPVDSLEAFTPPMSIDTQVVITIAAFCDTIAESRFCH